MLVQIDDVLDPWLDVNLFSGTYPQDKQKLTLFVGIFTYNE